MPDAPEMHVQLWQPGDGARLHQIRMQDMNKRLMPSQLTCKEAAERQAIEIDERILHVQTLIAAADRQHEQRQLSALRQQTTQQAKKEIADCNAIEMDAKILRAQAKNAADARQQAIAKEKYEQECRDLLETNRIGLEKILQQ